MKTDKNTTELKGNKLVLSKVASLYLSVQEAIDHSIVTENQSTGRKEAPINGLRVQELLLSIKDDLYKIVEDENTRPEPTLKSSEGLLEEFRKALFDSYIELLANDTYFKDAYDFEKELYSYADSVLSTITTKRSEVVTLKSSEGLVEEFEKIEYLINSLAIQTNVKAVKLLMKHSVSKSISEFKSLLSTITPTTETASEWISVEDRLPDAMTPVQVYPPERQDEDFETCNQHTGYLSINSEWVYSNGYTVFSHRNVTHWQPLPQPPKQDNEEEG